MTKTEWTATYRADRLSNISTGTQSITLQGYKYKSKNIPVKVERAFTFSFDQDTHTVQWKSYKLSKMKEFKFTKWLPIITTNDTEHTVLRTILLLGTDGALMYLFLEEDSFQKLPDYCKTNIETLSMTKGCGVMLHTSEYDYIACRLKISVHSDYRQFTFSFEPCDNQTTIAFTLPNELWKRGEDGMYVIPKATYRGFQIHDDHHKTFTVEGIANEVYTVGMRITSFNMLQTMLRQKIPTRRTSFET